jgi:hypothetical protein
MYFLGANTLWTILILTLAYQTDLNLLGTNPLGNHSFVTLFNCTLYGGGAWLSGLERCARISKITGSNPSSGSGLTFHSDLLLTARDGST